MKILISDQIEPVCAEVLRKEGFEVDLRPGLKNDELGKIIGEYEGLVVRSSTQVTSEIIGLAEKMKVIGRAGAGVG